MSRNVRNIKCGDWSEQKWVKYRDGGLGASDIPGVLGVSDYTDPIKIYLEKIGEPVTRFTGNNDSKAGHWMEPKIGYLYQFWDHNNPGSEEMWDNEKAGVRYNKIRDVKAYTVNKKYPHLFVSLDRIILGKNAILECKNTTSLEARKYPYKVNPSFIWQVQTQLLVSEKKFAEIAIFIDGKRMDVVTIYPDKEMFDHIILETTKFWEKVCLARQIKSEFGIDSYFGVNPDFLDEDKKEIVGMLQALEPEITGSTNELNLVKGLVTPTEEYTVMMGTPELEEIIINRNKVLRRENFIKKLKNKYDAEFIRSLGGYHEAHFEQEGGEVFKASYKPNKRGVCSIYVDPKFKNR